MEIQINFALVVSIFLGVSHAAEEPIHKEIVDLSHICDDHAKGHLVPHPLDCNAYFNCGSVPSLFYCDPGLKFDVVGLVCDVPQKVQCSTMESISAITTSIPKGLPNNVSGSIDNSDFDWAHKSQPVFVAVDVVTGQPVNPMDKYDPQHIECRHFGAYFLPHPSSCQLYFICAYGHLHRHQCGTGTHWNYRSSECQPIKNAQCYSNVNTLTSPDPLVELDKTPSIAPGTQVTVCYILSGTTTLPTEREPITNETASSPPSASQSTLICPSERQSYLPHPEDCSKYYICIVGMPVLTSCPKSLYWDQKAGYCDQAKNVKCFQNE